MSAPLVQTVQASVDLPLDDYGRALISYSGTGTVTWDDGSSNALTSTPRSFRMGGSSCSGTTRTTTRVAGSAVTNHDRHLEDQTIGQLVGILHNQAPDPEHLRMQLMAGIAADGQPVVAAGGFDLRAIIRRWVFGFHAALYGEFLNAGQQFMTFPPLAEGDKDTGQIQAVHAIVPEIVRVLRFNRGLGKVDRVVTRNEKCAYECVWIESDAPGVWFCAYALDLYGWVPR